jgi:hypothetical protein
MTNDDRNVSSDELESASGEPLPDREAMTILPIDPTGGGLLPLPVEPTPEGGGEHIPPVEPDVM